MKDLSNLPYRKGVGIMLLNQETKVFIGKIISYIFLTLILFGESIVF